MKTNILIALYCILFSIQALNSEPNNSYFYKYVASYPHTVGKAITSPLNWNKTEWLAAGGVIVIAGGLYLVEEDLRDKIQQNRSIAGDRIMTGFKQFGEGKYIIPAMGATILAGYLTDSDQTVNTGMLCLKSFLLANSATQILKFATQRERPYEEKGNQFWNDKHFSMQREAFPSGHTTVVWSLAPILAHQYSDTNWVAPMVYSIAALTSYSRINDDKHWASDVFFGAVVGFVTAKLVIGDTPSISIAPNPAINGVGFSYNF